jgi:hypothetical protein
MSLKYEPSLNNVSACVALLSKSVYVKVTSPPTLYVKVMMPSTQRATKHFRALRVGSADVGPGVAGEDESQVLDRTHVGCAPNHIKSHPVEYS